MATLKQNKCFIGDLDKVKLLMTLWEESQPAAFFRHSQIPAPDFDEDEAKNAIKYYIDYFCGRAVKTDISEEYANVHGYDRYMGDGAFERVCTLVRTNGEIKGKKMFPCIEKYLGDEMCYFCKSCVGDYSLITVRGERGCHVCKYCIKESYIKIYFPWFQPDMIK